MKASRCGNERREGLTGGKRVVREEGKNSYCFRVEPEVDQATGSTTSLLEEDQPSFGPV